MAAVGKTAWHLESSQPLSCQLCEYGLRRQPACPLGASSPPWPCVGVWGTEVFFITSMREWDQRPDGSCPAKYTLSGDTALGRAARGLWTCWLQNVSPVNSWKSTNRCVLFEEIHTQYSCDILACTSYAKSPYICFGWENRCLETIATVTRSFAVCPRVGLPENRQ